LEIDVISTYNKAEMERKIPILSFRELTVGGS